MPFLMAGMLGVFFLTQSPSFSSEASLTVKHQPVSALNNAVAAAAATGSAGCNPTTMRDCRVRTEFAVLEGTGQPYYNAN